MATTYDIGDKVRRTATFKNASSAVTDPTAVYYYKETPDGAVTKYTYAASSGDIVRTGTGVYYIDVTTTGHGLYEDRFTGTGTVVASVEGWFSVRQRRVST